jgi:hypothetical protein
MCNCVQQVGPEDGGAVDGCDLPWWQKGEYREEDIYESECSIL